jgi:hypothetical protein
MSENTTTTFLAEHPKMIGVLFTLLLVLSSTGVASAGMGSSIAGP